MICPNCNKQIADGLSFCSECGHNLRGAATSGFQSMGGTRDQSVSTDLVYPKNPPLSPHLTWLGLLICGLPQLIYGQVLKGIVICAAFYLSIPTAIGPLLILIAALVDGYMVGTTLQKGKAVGKWQFFPS